MLWQLLLTSAPSPHLLYRCTPSIPELFVTDSLILNKALCACESNARRRYRALKSVALFTRKKRNASASRELCILFRVKIEHIDPFS